MKSNRKHYFVTVLLLSTMACGGASSTTDNDDSDDDSPEEESGETDDTSDPGLPATKLSYQSTLAEDTVQGTADHYDFIDNPADYRILAETLHGTEISVAVHNDVDESEDTVSSWSANVRDCWHEAWHVFGGYRCDRYAVLVRSPSSSETVFSLSEYRSGMNERFEDYDEARGTSLDLSMAELADLIGTDTSHNGVGVLYARGALISYLLDKELVAAGFSLDDLMAHLYENFGLMDTAWSQAELEAALAQITGTDFSGFFNTYLDTSTTIDVEGEFDSPLSH